MYKFRIPIGDWSGDGHDRCIYYMVESECPVEEARETHFTLKEKFGFSPEEFANRYQDDTVPDYIYDKLVEMGCPTEFFNDDDMDPSVEPEGMCGIWMFMLNTANPNLKLRRIHDSVPMLPFYGRDPEGRHVGQVGYGCWSF